MIPLLALLVFSQQPAAHAMEGLASYYTVGSSGTMTASGEVLRDSDLTCAMRDGEFGSYYRVTAQNGLSVVCRLNDRGPFVKKRLIDLSEAAMHKLDPGCRKGVIKVRVEKVKGPERAAG